MLKLRTLGGLDLRDARDQKVSAVLAHPKRTALLVYLTLAAPRSFHRRDTLLAIFWPEANQELARASLRKAVHNLRRTLGDDAIVGQSDDELGVAPGVLSCDAIDFELAADAGDADAALDLYKGPLLDGFFLPDAPEFERWTERERARLRDRAFETTWKRAEKEERAAAPYEAAAWARKAAALMPDDEGALRRLLQLLEGLGDRAGAISAYDDFARRLSRDFDVEPSAETQALVAKIRKRAGSGKRDEERAKREAEGKPADQRERARPAPAVSAPAMRPWERRWARIAAGIALTVLAGWQMRRLYEAAASPPSPIATAVLPFSFRGGPEHSYLAGGMPTLLGTSLDGVGMQTADSASASYYVVGDIVEAGGRLRVSAELRDAHDRHTIARAAAEDSSSRVFGLVDRLAAQLVSSGPNQRQERLTQLASVTTSSLPALRAYLEGDAKFRVGHYKEAVDAFQHAISLDSSFALAFYRLAVAYCWSGDTLCAPTARQAVRLSHRLSASDRMLLEAYVAFTDGDADDAERRFREIVRLRPFDGEAWYQLGEVLFHFNGVRGRPIDEARPAFQRALANGPKDASLTHLLEIEAIAWNYATYDSLVPGINAGSHFDLVGRTVTAFTRGDEPSRLRVIEENRRAQDSDLANYARHALFLLEDRQSAARVVRLLLDPVRPAEARALGHILLAHLEAASGRMRSADAELRLAEALDRTRALEHRGLLETLPFLPVTRDRRLATREALASWSGDASGSIVFTDDRSLHPRFRQYLVGLLSADVGDVDRTRHAMQELETGVTTADQFATMLARGLRARLLALQGGDRRDDALRELDKPHAASAVVALVGVVPFYAQGTERYLRAELLRELGRNEEALSWYGSFGQHSAFDRVYLAPAHRRMGELLERQGKRAEAASHYEKFVALWKDSDPELQPQVDEVRARLARLR
jgi:DNA-binding SARP family transcriptional activator/Flp pilus assembly protein TadD